MCGIAGTFALNDSFLPSASNLQSMARSLAHRGPDDEAIFLRGPVGLAFRRLSIIDLAAGRQPMCDSEGRIWLVFNGEIYNFKQLRSELQACGHCFRTQSDTEVILYSYKQWGNDFLLHLNGMFGLGLWDERNNVFILARDRLGVKPIYYRLTGDGLAFGSEIRAVLAGTAGNAQVDPNAVNLFLRYRYTPAPFTLYKDIQKLAAGTRLVIEGGVPRLERWWNFSPRPFHPSPTVRDAEEELLDLYRAAVERQLVSDVPVGLLLSGGLDSGLLLALMAKKHDSWPTFTVGFGDRFGRDEMAKAAETARYLNSPHVGVEISREEFEEGLPQVVKALEEPVASDSILPMYFLCRRARQDVKVALMGQGPDELFGGYRRHLAVRYGQYSRLVPSCLKRLAAPMLNRALGRTAARRLIGSWGESDRLRRYRNVFTLLPGDFIDSLFQPGTLDPDADSKILRCWDDLAPLMAQTDELGGLQFLELRSSLPDELLLYADKLSMANGLEVRVPYLDHEIVQYAERLAASFKVRGTSGKWLHRRLCQRVLPQHITARPKLGFETPFGDWFRQNGTFLSRLLEDSRSAIYQYLRPEAVQAVLSSHRTGKQNYADTLFSLVSLELWLRTSSA